MLKIYFNVILNEKISERNDITILHIYEKNFTYFYSNKEIGLSASLY